MYYTIEHKNILFLDSFRQSNIFLSDDAISLRMERSFLLYRSALSFKFPIITYMHVMNLERIVACSTVKYIMQPEGGGPKFN